MKTIKTFEKLLHNIIKECNDIDLDSIINKYNDILIDYGIDNPKKFIVELNNVKFNILFYENN
jgi:aspartyl-tRNA synthetase